MVHVFGTMLHHVLDSVCCPRLRSVFINHCESKIATVVLLPLASVLFSMISPVVVEFVSSVVLPVTSLPSTNVL